MANSWAKNQINHFRALNARSKWNAKKSLDFSLELQRVHRHIGLHGIENNFVYITYMVNVYGAMHQQQNRRKNKSVVVLQMYCIECKQQAKL